MDREKIARGNAFELVLNLCSGASKSCATTDYEKGYNDALGDIYDYIIRYESDYLLKSTIRAGLWKREEKVNEQETAY